MNNNAYLYNFILSSSILNYDQAYTSFLGLDGSLALYLFHYSKELFFMYPVVFKECSIITDSDIFLNICSFLIQNISLTSNIIYDNGISFNYLNRFTFTIQNKYNTINYHDLYINNDHTTIAHNGLIFNVLPIECVVAYSIDQYIKKNKNLQYLMNILVLSTVYKTQILYNNVLINLLRLNLNIKKVLKAMMKDIKKLTSSEIPNLKFSDDIIRQRTLDLLEFCHG
jgi:hypothetical protein